MKLTLANPTLRLVLIGLALGGLVMLAIIYQTFELGDGGLDKITATRNYPAILFVNALVVVSIVLFVLELKRDAVRILLTVGVALLFGFLMTMFFNLDAADILIRGNFQARVLSDGDSPIDLSYDQDIEATFDAETAEAAYSFIGSTGDEVTILVYALDPDSGLDLQMALLDQDGAEVATATEADRRVQRQYSDYITSERDAAIRAFELPADGLYTIMATPEQPLDADTTGQFGVALLSDADSAAGLIYNGPNVGDIFNREGATNPLTEIDYYFIGAEGDEVTLLAHARRASDPIDLEIALYDENGTELATNQDASEEQVTAYEDLKSTRDAIIEEFELPTTGTYRIHIKPQPVTTATQIRETLDATINAYDAFLLGPISKLNRWLNWQRDALTLIILGLAITIVFRAEQFSLGADGQLYFGALVSGVIVLYFSDTPRALLVPVALLSAATAGFLWGLLPGALKAYLGANELVSTLMLNTIATRFYEMVLVVQLTPPDAGYTSSDPFTKNGLLPPIITVEQNTLTVAVYILIALVLLTWVLIQRTPLGYEIRMIGANLKFADYGGVNTKRTIMLAMAISGGVAGLAGAHLTMGVHRQVILNISIGLGFEGIVVALLARQNPLVVPFTGLLYAYLRTGAEIMEADANVSAEIVLIIQAVVILLITAEALAAFFQTRRQRQRDQDGDKPVEATPLTPAEGGANG